MTVRQGSSAWLWKITARSRLGPSIASPSTITTPSDGVSRPARMLSTVVLPQPEWPITQVNSPRFMASHRFSKIVVDPPWGAGYRLSIPSSEMNLSAIISLRERHQPREPRQDLVQHHADQPNQQDRVDHIRDREIIPFIPDEVAD